jgi:hypothetical protein
MTLEFDPNKNKKPEYNWATYVPDRHPKFKAHRHKGHAKNAFQYRDQIILYKWNEDTQLWDEIYQVDGYPNECYKCKKPGTTYYSGKRGVYLHTIWHPNKEFKRIEICYECEREL